MLMTGVLVMIALLYLWFGVGSFATALYFSIYGPPPLEGMTVIFVALSLINAVASLAVAYAFFCRRRWGRYLILTFNGIYLTVMIGGFLVAQLTERPQVPFPAVIVSLGILVLLGGMMLLCLRPSVRMAMSR